MLEDEQLSKYRQANERLLNNRFFLGDFLISRTGLLELRQLIAKSKAGEIEVNEVLNYIDPGIRTPMPHSSTLFGLGYQLDQEVRTVEDMNLAGFTRATEIELVHKVAEAREDILKAVSGSGPHLAIADHDREDPVEVYFGAVNKLFDYFENLFEPAAVIRRCESQIADIEKYLAGGMNVRRNQPLTKSEIALQNLRRLSYQQAIERNKART